MTKNALLKRGPKNSGIGRPPPPSFGQCPKENVFFQLMSSLMALNCLGHVSVGKQKCLCQPRSGVGGVWKSTCAKRRGVFLFGALPTGGTLGSCKQFKGWALQVLLIKKRRTVCIVLLFKLVQNAHLLFSGNNLHNDNILKTIIKNHYKQCSREQDYILWSSCFIGCSAFALCKHPSGHRW